MTWERDEPDPYAEHAQAGHRQCPTCGRCENCDCSCPLDPVDDDHEVAGPQDERREDA